MKSCIRFKIIVTLFYLVWLSSCCVKNEFSGYRNNPFQFPYQEYYLKPDTVALSQAVEPVTKPGAFVEISLKDYSFSLDTAWFDRMSIIDADTSSLGFFKNGRRTFVVSYNEEKMMGCLDSAGREAEKDFCSAFHSSEDYFFKLFVLTPDDLGKDEYFGRGYEWIVHHKGSYFERVRKTAIYRRDEIVIFRRDFKKTNTSLLTTELIIFPKKIAPDFLTVGLISTPDEFVMNFIGSFY
ncbi:MAG: hypothetical protein JW795_08555 [Chitinivibrionales bacterium]|nr:hypothetical protein [Chitinivibrionales bacterium]